MMKPQIGFTNQTSFGSQFDLTNANRLRVILLPQLIQVAHVVQPITKGNVVSLIFSLPTFRGEALTIPILTESNQVKGDVRQIFYRVLCTMKKVLLTQGLLGFQTQKGLYRFQCLGQMLIQQPEYDQWIIMADLISINGARAHFAHGYCVPRSSNPKNYNLARMITSTERVMKPLCDLVAKFTSDVLQTNEQAPYLNGLDPQTLQNLTQQGIIRTHFTGFTQFQAHRFLSYKNDTFTRSYYATTKQGWVPSPPFQVVLPKQHVLQIPVIRKYKNIGKQIPPINEIQEIRQKQDSMQSFFGQSLQVSQISPARLNLSADSIQEYFEYDSQSYGQRVLQEQEKEIEKESEKSLKGGQQFFVTSLRGQTVAMYGSPKDRVYNLLNLISHKSGIPRQAFYIVFQGRVLDQYRTLQQVGVTTHSTLVVLLRLRGGGDKQDKEKQRKKRYEEIRRLVQSEQEYSPSEEEKEMEPERQEQMLPKKGKAAVKRARKSYPIEQAEKPRKIRKLNVVDEPQQPAFEPQGAVVPEQRLQEVDPQVIVISDDQQSQEEEQVVRDPRFTYTVPELQRGHERGAPVTDLFLLMNQFVPTEFQQTIRAIQAVPAHQRYSYSDRFVRYLRMLFRQHIFTCAVRRHQNLFRIIGDLHFITQQVRSLMVIQPLQLRFDQMHVDSGFLQLIVTTFANADWTQLQRRFLLGRLDVVRVLEELSERQDIWIWHEQAIALRGFSLFSRPVLQAFVQFVNQDARQPVMQIYASGHRRFCTARLSRNLIPEIHAIRITRDRIRRRSVATLIRRQIERE